MIEPFFELTNPQYDRLVEQVEALVLGVDVTARIAGQAIAVVLAEIGGVTREEFAREQLSPEAAAAVIRSSSEQKPIGFDQVRWPWQQNTGYPTPPPGKSHTVCWQCGQDITGTDHRGKCPGLPPRQQQP